MTDLHGLPRWPAVPVEIGFNALMLATFLLLRRVASPALRGQHFHVYLMAYGTFRFFHEFLRATPRLSHGLTGYQLAALAVATLGAAGYLRRRGATLSLPAHGEDICQRISRI